MRGLRIGFGLCSGLFMGLLGLSLGQCSFYLPERNVCTGDLGCGPTGPDLRPMPPDMTRDPNDPGMPGSFPTKAEFAVPPPFGIIDGYLWGPSEDGATVSNRQSTYPLVLMAPPKGVPLAPMRMYADRLISDGFFVGLFLVSDQSKDLSYRNTALAYLDAVLTQSDMAARSRIDGSKLGMLGYELSAKIGVTMAAARQGTATAFSGLFAIEPTDLFAMETQSGVQTIATLGLAGGNSIVMLGDPRSTTGSQPCVQPPQKAWGEFYASASSPTLAIVFGGANLGDFMAEYPDPYCYQGSTAPTGQTQDLAKKFATAYFQWTLKGSSRAREYLYGADFNADAQTAMLTPMSK